jgi:hypothetical protein
MGIFAILEKRWIEAIGWAGGIMALSLIFAIHDYFASQLYHPGDVISASWLAAGGLRFALDSARWNIAFHALPAPLLVLALACALIGLTASKDPRAWRAAFVVMGYLAAFLFIGRPDNDYWGILYTPLLPLGFVYAPRALRDLWSSARRETKTVPG